MARVIEASESRLQQSFGRGAPEIYPWDEWTDGQIYAVVAEEDFTCTVKTFREQLHQVARKRGKRARTTAWRDNGQDIIEFQFKDRSEA